MTALGVTTRPSAPAPGEPSRAGGGRPGGAGPLAQLLLGARLMLAGGPTAWLRVAMTGLGVGLGVALLLVATALPAILDARDGRREARSWDWAGVSGPSDTTMMLRGFHAEIRGHQVDGYVLRPDGAHPPLPPGVSALPGPGEMVVSPALARLLGSAGDGSEAARRLPYERVGTIGGEGLSGPNELYVYIGAPAETELRTAEVSETIRIVGFGGPVNFMPMPVELVILMIVVVVVLLLPIGAFTAAAVRFGGEARDRQLAAVRLLGADPAMARLVAAGGALVSALAGCAAGAALFAAGRALVGHFTLFGASVFTADVRPSPVLGALVLAAVPVSAVALTVILLRRVVIEPLGVVRRAVPARRRLWWRLVLPVVGLALVLPLDANDDFGLMRQAQLGTGMVLTLLGVTVLLPWAVEAGVRRLGAGPTSWQLAVRRLQLDNASAVRAVAAVSVAVAGAIALQMVFAVAEKAFVQRAVLTDDGLARMLIEGSTSGLDTSTLAQAISAAGTGATARVFAQGYVSSVDPVGGDPQRRLGATLIVADCATLRELADLAACADGDVFLTHSVPKGAGANVPPAAPPVTAVVDAAQLADPATLAVLSSGSAVLAGPGVRLVVGDPSATPGDPVAESQWTVPPGAAEAASTEPMFQGVLATPGAVPAKVVDALRPTAFADVPPGAADVIDRLRGAIADADPLANVSTYGEVVLDPRFPQIRTALYVGTVLVLGLIGASLLVTTVEQLRERRRVLAVLVAFGTRRGTLALWRSLCCGRQPCQCCSAWGWRSGSASGSAARCCAWCTGHRSSTG
ncbi:FtsX-like permease family protein [Pseudofrankia asymbiotica]|uniref:FtsX-like permease family protein n=1 Tax=Pseudofrankia asymbiotica TaxID=1834516 RepID=UPI001F5236C7|nr:FtsX-like permease family protein [Pseudofrankia asymbiotica]